MARWLGLSGLGMGWLGLRLRLGIGMVGSRMGLRLGSVLGLAALLVQRLGTVVWQSWVCLQLRILRFRIACAPATSGGPSFSRLSWRARIFNSRGNRSPCQEMRSVVG